MKSKSAREMLLDVLAGRVGDPGISINQIRGATGKLAVFLLSHKSSDAHWLKFYKVHMQILFLRRLIE